MKRHYLLTDTSGNGKVTITVESGSIPIVVNFPTQQTLDVTRLDEKTRNEISLDPGDFKLDRGKVTKKEKQQKDR